MKWNSLIINSCNKFMETQKRSSLETPKCAWKGMEMHSYQIKWHGRDGQGVDMAIFHFSYAIWSLWEVEYNSKILLKSEVHWLKGVLIMLSHFRSNIRGTEENFSWIIRLLQWNLNRYFEVFFWKTEYSSIFREYTEMTKPKVAQASNLFLFPDLRFQVPKKVYLLTFTKMRSYFLLLFFSRWD